MSKAKLFLDSSALFAGIASPSGGGRALIRHAWRYFRLAARPADRRISQLNTC
jgi:hypothetical protein